MEARTLRMEARTLRMEARTLRLSAFVVRNSACTLAMKALILRWLACDVNLQGLTMGIDGLSPSLHVPPRSLPSGRVRCGGAGVAALPSPERHGRPLRRPFHDRRPPRP